MELWCATHQASVSHLTSAVMVWPTVSTSNSMSPAAQVLHFLFNFPLQYEVLSKSVGDKILKVDFLNNNRHGFMVLVWRHEDC